MMILSRLRLSQLVVITHLEVHPMYWDYRLMILGDSTPQYLGD